MLHIVDLHASIKGKKVLYGVNLSMQQGEIHAVMGPNGAGKSTLAKAIAGDPEVTIEQGQIVYEGSDLVPLPAEERGQRGVFMGFQYPTEIPGVSNRGFLYAALQARRKGADLPPISDEEFEHLLDEKMSLLDIPTTFKGRNVNEGFSGGEKKRNEMLQMAVLDAQLAVLDEMDSGLDIGALRCVSQALHRLLSPTKALLLITHYQRFLQYIPPHHVHVMVEGKVALSGGPELALRIENYGYGALLA